MAGINHEIARLESKDPSYIDGVMVVVIADGMEKLNEEFINLSIKAGLISAE